MFMGLRHKRIALTLALTAIVLVSADAAPATSQPASSSDIRGVWVLRTSLTSAESIAKMVQAVRAAGLNTILVQVRGRGEALYRSDVEPRASDLRDPDFDPLATTLTLAHKSGLRVHAWVNIGLISSAVTLSRSPEHVVRAHPEWLMVPRPLAAELSRMRPDVEAYTQTLARWSRENNTRVEGLFLSPVVPAAQEHTIAVVKELATRYALDGLHFDYIRYPNEDFDYSRAALAEFRASHAPTVAAAERQEIDRAAGSRPTAWADAAPVAWADFRRERVTSLLARAAAAARAVRPGLVISAAVVPNPTEAREDKLQDWPAWAKSELLDVLCPMAYAQTSAEFTAQIRSAVGAAAGTPIWAGIGAYRLPAARTAEHVRTARRSGASGVLLFSYDSLIDNGAAPQYFQSLRSVLLEGR
jgi:uncharacterized lipoprotein YddW (UPF0748 family)